MRFLPAGTMLVALITAGGAVAHRSPAPVDWRSIVRPRDRDRLRDWRATWITALAQARATGEGAHVDAEGTLLEPDAAIMPPDAPDGDYRCRLVKLGQIVAGGPTFAAMPAVPCRIAGRRIAVLGGPQRPAGRLWPLDGLHLVFLGAVAVSDERGALDYGRDPDRNAAGMFERIGTDRWRLVLPKPQWEALVDVIDIVPAPAPTRSAGG